MLAPVGEEDLQDQRRIALTRRGERDALRHLNCELDGHFR